MRSGIAAPPGNSSGTVVGGGCGSAGSLASLKDTWKLPPERTALASQPRTGPSLQTEIMEHVINPCLTGRLAKVGIDDDDDRFKATFAATKLLLAAEIETTVEQWLPIVRETPTLERRKTFYDMALLTFEQATE